MGITEPHPVEPGVVVSFDTRHSLRAALGQLLVRTDLGLLLVALPLLLFPVGYLPWVGLALGAAGWILRSLRTGTWLVHSPLNRPLLVVLLMTLVSLYPSVDTGLSMSKFYGISLGFFIFFATVGNVEAERHFWCGIVVLVTCIVGVLLLGSIGTQWNAYKAPMLQEAYGRLPRIISSIQTSVGVAPGFHANEVGGTLAFLLPVPMALIIGAPLNRRYKVALAAVVLATLGLLVITASRSAYMAFGVSVLLLVVWRWRRVGIALVVIGVVGLGVALNVDARAVVDFLLKMDISSSSITGVGTFAYRAEIWERALYMVQDFPFTGIGLNTFPIVLDTLYPSFLAGSQVLPHAHNIFLQTAVDLGVGGLLGFLALCACTAYVGWVAYRGAAASCNSGRPIQAAIVGVLLGLVSYLIFGLTDAITLGAKPTVMLWLMMGLLVSVQRMTLNVEQHFPALQSATLGSDPLLRRSVRLVATSACGFYWITTFVLVGLAYVVVLLLAVL